MREEQTDMVAAHHCHHSMSTGTSTHQVQFYDEESYLHGVLSDYFAPFLADDAGWLGAIVLARARTIDYLRDCLSKRQYTYDGTADNEELRRKSKGSESVTPIGAVYKNGERRVVLVDGDMVVAKLVLGDEVKAEEFDKMLNEILSQLTAGLSLDSQQQSHELPIYAYGELVDILCARGQHLVALELESLWNRFLTTGNMSLLCGYKLDSFRDLQVENVFDYICNSHSVVKPTETYSSLATMEQKHTMVAVLQRKVMALHPKQPFHQSRGEAEQQIRYREQFVDTLCHELRNPVSAIVGNVELLQDGLDLRQSILHQHHGGDGAGDFRLSNADVVSLRDQLADDLVSVDAIATCAEHMKTISDDVLTLSKLEDGKVVLEKVPFDPKATIMSAIRMFSTLAQRKGIQLLEDLPAEKLLVVGDPGRLAQVVINLISNAIKFTDTGNITVQLQCLRPSYTSGGSLNFKVAVRDTGRGLSQDEISMLFQRFAQPSSTSFAIDGGTGLGLYICKYLVDLMGGAMYVESRKGGGSTFIFTFLAEEYSLAEDFAPLLVLDKEYADASPSAAPLPYRLATSQGAKNIPTSQPPALSIISPATNGTSAEECHRKVRHVLVVDDNPVILRTLRRILESASCSSLCVSTATNGYDAISKLIALSTSSSPIDLILMDLNMPFMDGLRAASEIRRLGNHYPEISQSAASEAARRMADTPIIGLTGEIRKERFEEARRNGMDECIEKPVIKATLLDLIDKVARWQTAPVQRAKAHRN
jgi:signal transduction histidine kinase/CheY-like chemotaxis protein